MSHFEKVKCEMDTVDRHMNYTFCCDIGLQVFSSVLLQNYYASQTGIVVEFFM